MRRNNNPNFRRWGAATISVLGLIALLALTLALNTGGASASRLGANSPRTSSHDPLPPVKFHGPFAPLADSYMELVPEAGGPPNGGTAQVNDRWIFDLILHAGSEPEADIHQTYLTFTKDLIVNARVSS